MGSAAVQNIATVAVAALGWALAYIALSAHHYQRLGQETLLCMSVYLTGTAVIRTLSINGFITSETGRVLVGMMAFAALAVIAQLAWLKAVDHRLRKKETP